MKKVKNNKYLADAQSFLKLAQNEFGYLHWDMKGKLYAPVCFWSHQVAEKALKALLFYYDTGLIKKHKLEKQLLSEIIKVNQKAEVLRISCRFLDQFYIPVRYGSPEDIDYSRQVAEKAIIAAEKILKFVEKEISN